MNNVNTAGIDAPAVISAVLGGPFVLPRKQVQKHFFALMHLLQTVADGLTLHVE